MGFLSQAVHNYVLEAVVKLFIMEFEFLTQAVHSYVRFNSCSEGNIRQELRHFTSDLIEAYSLSLVAVHEGSVVIVLGVHTLEGQFQECTIHKKYIGRTGRKPNFVLGSLSSPISAPVHDDSGIFRHYCKDTKNGLPQVTFSVALVVSGGEFGIVKNVQ